ncbi:hypothetical protein GB937_001304 [Aspergillus fischeri]|nr:hypothetical protein GB937_001304 [Aspergillus fischeri]
MQDATSSEEELAVHPQEGTRTSPDGPSAEEACSRPRGLQKVHKPLGVHRAMGYTHHHHHAALLGQSMDMHLDQFSIGGRTRINDIGVFGPHITMEPVVLQMPEMKVRVCLLLVEREV